MGAHVGGLVPLLGCHCWVPLLGIGGGGTPSNPPTSSSRSSVHSVYKSLWQSWQLLITTRHHKEPQISLRSRSRTKSASSPTTSRARVSTPKTGNITLRPKALKDTYRGDDQPDVSASETGESQQVEIPPAEVEVADWRRPSQERDEEDYPDDPDDLMPIPKPKPMDEDWKISVQKAFEDASLFRGKINAVVWSLCTNQL